MKVQQKQFWIMIYEYSDDVGSSWKRLKGKKWVKVQLKYDQWLDCLCAECGMKFKWAWIEGEEQNAKAD